MASWQSGQAQAPKSKRDMVAALASVGREPIKAKLAARNTLDYVGADGRRRIRLHKTDILTFTKDGAGFTIDTGGWNTPTTRARLNEYLPAGWQVGTTRGRLYLAHYAIIENGYAQRRDYSNTEFRETISVSANGKVKSDVSPKAADKLAKQIDVYMAAWRKRGLPSAEDSGGDPWIFTEGKVEASVMLGWIKSKYVHRRLYSLALAYAGMTPQGIAYRHHSADQRGLDRVDYGRIRRYVRNCLGM